MADNRIESLPEDVEIDGEAPLVGRQKMLDHFKTPQMFNKALESQCDSGNFSMSPQTSLESGSLKSVDKLPVQCSDGGANSCMAVIESKLAAVNVQDDDEGILSVESLQSLESLGSSSEPVEVDLFEQDVDGDTLIHLAILGDAPRLATVLIDIAEDISCLNLQNDLYQTPLHLAIITEHYDIAIQLVKKGVDIKRCDKQGNSPLHLACRNGEKDVVQALLDTFGNDKLSRQKYFTMKNCAGLTCLHLAAEKKQFILMGYLFAKGADVNMGDAKSGRTVLHYAVEKRDLETVTLLLTHPEIDSDCRTFKGETPLVLAYWRNYQDIVKRLKSRGAYFSYDLFEESDDDDAS